MARKSMPLDLHENKRRRTKNFKGSKLELQ